MIQRLEFSYLEQNIDMNKVWKSDNRVSIPCYSEIEKRCVLDALERCITQNVYNINVDSKIGLPDKLLCTATDGFYFKYEDNNLDCNNLSSIDKCIRVVDNGIRVTKKYEDKKEENYSCYSFIYYSKNNDIKIYRKLEILIESLFENVRLVYRNGYIDFIDAKSKKIIRDNGVLLCYNILNEILFSKIRSIVLLDDIGKYISKEVENKLLEFIEKNKNVEQIFSVYERRV